MKSVACSNSMLATALLPRRLNNAPGYTFLANDSPDWCHAISKGLRRFLGIDFNQTMICHLHMLDGFSSLTVWFQSDQGISMVPRHHIVEQVGVGLEFLKLLHQLAEHLSVVFLSGIVDRMLEFSDESWWIGCSSLCGGCERYLCFWLCVLFVNGKYPRLFLHTRALQRAQQQTVELVCYEDR